MKSRHFLSLAFFGFKTILFRQKKPILATIILTDSCNLSCRHCAVNNITGRMLSYRDVLAEMQAFYREGVRILFFCGGETLLWQDGGKNIRDLMKEAKKMGFYLVNLVTNGTLELNIPEADVLFLSLDGNRESHNLIRGDTYDQIMRNLNRAENCNICIYMAVNKLNYRHIEEVCQQAKEHPHLRSISFNFHTPYPGTESLTLDAEEKRVAVAAIKKMIVKGMPIFNLPSALDTFLENHWSRPCHQCVVSENKQRYLCGRCVEIDGLCRQCGYLFAVEFSLLCAGNPRAIYEMLRTYLKYI
ncbi:radical SAM protein [Desulforamulus ruminis]|uniref:radical SAM protein n=1 Tax=Desulforamulus ruminis TaxID=1564 RepID=UPI002355375C|nr:radical SAM protein [Desulforamulus ruminis]